MSFDRKLCFWKGYSLMSETLHYYLKRNENAHVYSQGKRKNTVLQYYGFFLSEPKQQLCGSLTNFSNKHNNLKFQYVPRLFRNQVGRLSTPFLHPQSLRA